MKFGRECNLFKKKLRKYYFLYSQMYVLYDATISILKEICIHVHKKAVKRMFLVLLL